MKVCSSDFVVGTTESDVPGLTYTTPHAGDWIVTTSIDLECTSTAFLLLSSLFVDGVSYGGVIVATMTSGNRLSLSKTWLIEGLASGKVIKQRGVRTGGGYTIYATHSVMTIQQVG